MVKYTVFDGTYPFNTVIGTVHVEAEPDMGNDHELDLAREAARALNTAIEIYGGHPAVACAH